MCALQDGDDVVVACGRTVRGLRLSNIVVEFTKAPELGKPMKLKRKNTKLLVVEERVECASKNGSFIAWSPKIPIWTILFQR